MKKSLKRRKSPKRLSKNTNCYDSVDCIIDTLDNSKGVKIDDLGDLEENLMKKSKSISRSESPTQKQGRNSTILFSVLMEQYGIHQKKNSSPTHKRGGLKCR